MPPFRLEDGLRSSQSSIDKRYFLDACFGGDRLIHKGFWIAELLQCRKDCLAQIKDREFNKTRNLILESAALPQFPKLKIWF
jgi:hypothetical protein